VLTETASATTPRREQRLLPPRFSGIIAVVEQVRYISDKYNHTAFVYENSTHISEFRQKDWYGTLQAAVATNMEEAVEILRKEVYDLVNRDSYAPPTSFKFTVLYSEIKDGKGWFIPSISDCKEYNVALPEIDRTL
jgi:hypothetical protein